MTVFHVVEFSQTETLSPGVERTTFSYEIQAADGRAVPHRFQLEWDASIICGVLNRFQSDAGRLQALIHAQKKPDER